MPEQVASTSLSATPVPAGRKCVHCNGKGYGPVCCGQPVQDDIGEYCCNNPDVDACSTCNGEGTITTIEQYIKTLPADWHQDSSLEKWFPLTGQELKLQRERIIDLEKKLTDSRSKFDLAYDIMRQLAAENMDTMQSCHFGYVLRIERERVAQPDLPHHLDSRYPNDVMSEAEPDECAACLAHPTRVCSEHFIAGVLG